MTGPGFTDRKLSHRLHEHVQTLQQKDYEPPFLGVYLVYSIAFPHAFQTFICGSGHSTGMGTGRTVSHKADELRLDTVRGGLFRFILSRGKASTV